MPLVCWMCIKMCVKCIGVLDVRQDVCQMHLDVHQQALKFVFEILILGFFCLLGIEKHGNPSHLVVKTECAIYIKERC